ncbi:immunity 22 family protein [Flaviaesturariibacter amylovorans]|uniref:Immunity protein 22 n=1 Tax=Flaviaesturariibacter amylovorans TaxID=1084520 RepID=A0ABP8HE24_9BACT
MTEPTVAIWVGNFTDEAALRSYTSLVYDDEGEATSPFAHDTGLEWYDEDFMEAIMIDPRDPLTAIGRASYAASFLPQLQPLAARLAGHNACILLYDLEDPVEMRSSAAVTFAGTFAYSPDEAG